MNFFKTYKKSIIEGIILGTCVAFGIAIRDNFNKINKFMNKPIGFLNKPIPQKCIPKTKTIVTKSCPSINKYFIIHIQSNPYKNIIMADGRFI